MGVYEEEFVDGVRLLRVSVCERAKESVREKMTDSVYVCVYEGGCVIGVRLVCM